MPALLGQEDRSEVVRRRGRETVAKDEDQPGARLPRPHAGLAPAREGVERPLGSRAGRLDDERPDTGKRHQGRERLDRRGTITRVVLGPPAENRAWPRRMAIPVATTMPTLTNSRKVDMRHEATFGCADTVGM